MDRDSQAAAASNWLSTSKFEILGDSDSLVVYFHQPETIPTFTT